MERELQAWVSPDHEHMKFRGIQSRLGVSVRVSLPLRQLFFTF